MTLPRAGAAAIAASAAARALTHTRRIRAVIGAILVVLLNHPALIAAYAEDLAHLDLTSPDARRLRDALIRQGEETTNADELARTLSHERVARLVAVHRVRFGLDDDARAVAPYQLAADQLSGAGEGIAFEEGALEGCRHGGKKVLRGQ